MLQIGGGSGERQGTRRNVIAVGPCCRGGLACTVGWVEGRGTEEFEREEVESMNGEGLGEGGERTTNWPEWHLRGCLSIRRGRVCAGEGEERQRRVPLAVLLGRRMFV